MTNQIAGADVSANLIGSYSHMTLQWISGPFQARAQTSASHSLDAFHHWLVHSIDNGVAFGLKIAKDMKSTVLPSALQFGRYHNNTKWPLHWL